MHQHSVSLVSLEMWAIEGLSIVAPSDRITIRKIPEWFADGPAGATTPSENIALKGQSLHKLLCKYNGDER